IDRYGHPIAGPSTPQSAVPLDDGYARVQPNSFQNGQQQQQPPQQQQQHMPFAVNDVPWRPPTVMPNMERPAINVEELAGKQMLPLEPRPILEPAIDDTTMTPMSRFLNILEILRFRGLYQGANKAFSVVDVKGRETASWTWEKLQGRAEKISQSIIEKTQLRRGSRVALVYRKSEIMDFLAAFFGCMMAGMTAVPINVIEEFAEMTYILTYTNAELALTTEYNHKALTRDLAMHKGVDWPLGVQWWKTDTLGSWHPKKKEGWPDIELPDLAYIEYSKAPNGELKGVAVSHRTVLSQCHAIKQALGTPQHAQQNGSPVFMTSRTQSNATTDSMHTLPSPASPSGRPMPDTFKGDTVLTWLEPRQQVGLVLGGLLGLYRGSHTIFIHSGVTDTPGLWQHCAQRYKITMALGDYEGVRELLRFRPGEDMKQKMEPLTSLRKFLIDTVMVRPLLDQRFANEFLTDLGVPNPQQVVVPMSSLPEHGGMILSMRDHLLFPRGADVIDFGFEYDIPRGPLPEPGSKPRPRGHSPASDAICHYLLDRGALKSNVIQILATGEEALARASERGVVLVGAFGYAMPRATLAVVDPETTALCQPNRVGEIWVDSPSIAFGFWELPKHSQSIFHALPLIVPVDTMIPEVYDPVPAGFLRTGLLGGLIEGRVVIFGLYEDRIQQEIVDLDHPEIVEYDYHYTPDLANTILDRIVGFTACIAFEVFVNTEHLPVICAETPRSQRSDLVKLADFAMQAMVDYHGLRLYCIAIAPSGTLPRSFKNGKRVLHPVLCRKMFELGRLRLMHISTSIDNTIFNIAYGDDTTGGIWGVEALAVREATMPPHSRMIQFSCCDYPKEVLDEKSKVNLSQFNSLPELLVWRTLVNQDDVAFASLDGRGKESKPVTFRKFGVKVVSIAQYIDKRGGFKAGDRVVLLFPNGIEFAATVYACWFLGLVPVPIQLPEAPRLHEDIVSLMGVLTELKASNLIGNNATEELLKQKTTLIHIKACIGPRQDTALPTVFNVSKAPKVTKNLGKDSGYIAPPRACLSPTSAALVFVHYSTDTRRSMVKVSHSTLMAQCRAHKVQCRMKNGRPLLSCWKSLSGIGFLYSCALGVYVGAPTITMQHSDFMSSPHIYFDAVERHGVKDLILSYPMIEYVWTCNDPALASTAYNFSCVKNFMIAAEGRPRTEVNQLVERRYSHHRLEPTAVNIMFGHMINPMVTTRSYMNVEPIRLHLSLKSLRRGIVQVTTEQEDPTGIWVEDSGIPICGTTVAIVNPETREICLSREIGEIWVSSEANVQSFHGRHGGRSLSNASPLSVEASAVVPLTDATPGQNGGSAAAAGAAATSSGASPNSGADVNSRYNVTIAGGDNRITYVRTGEIGFLWNYSNDNFNGGKPTSLLFVLGSIGETFEVNGLIHFPKDIEATIERAHPNIAPQGSIVFQVDQAVVCVVQVKQPDATVVNLTLSVMHQVLEKHQFMPDVIAVVGDGVLTKNRFGEKQRGKMLNLFMSAKMPLLYIHYPRGTIPPSVPEQLPPPASMFVQPHLSRSSVGGSSSSSGSVNGANGGGSGSAGSGGSGKDGKDGKPSSIRSRNSNASMASLRSVRSVRSFIGTMFQNLKRGSDHGSASFIHFAPGHPNGLNSSNSGSMSSLHGPGSRPGSGSSLHMLAVGGGSGTGLGGMGSGSRSMSSITAPHSPSSPKHNASSTSSQGGGSSPSTNAENIVAPVRTASPDPVLPPLVQPRSPPQASGTVSSAAAANTTRPTPLGGEGAASAPESDITITVSSALSPTSSQPAASASSQTALKTNATAPAAQQQQQPSQALVEEPIKSPLSKPTIRSPLLTRASVTATIKSPLLSMITGGSHSNAHSSPSSSSAVVETSPVVASSMAPAPSKMTAARELARSGSLTSLATTSASAPRGSIEVSTASETATTASGQQKGTQQQEETSKGTEEVKETEPQKPTTAIATLPLTPVSPSSSPAATEEQVNNGTSKPAQPSTEEKTTTTSTESKQQGGEEPKEAPLVVNEPKTTAAPSEVVAEGFP
ncbi:hypothetical protein BGW42_006007, partial [Actinomortierella wolfii]